MIINSLIDNDLYKFTMMQVVLHHFPSAEVKYKFVCRNKDVDLRPYISRIKEEIKQLCDLKFKKEELNYLRTFRFFKKDFIDYLEDFSLKERTINVFEEDGNMSLEINGSWLSTILLEVPLLAIISEVYMKDKKFKPYAFADGIEIAKEKIEKIKKCSVPFKMADFGTRRRFSREWHECIVAYYLKELGKETLTGTSNLAIAKELDITPIGTMAHEYLSAGQGLNKVQLVNSQQYMLDMWAHEYRGDLGIALTDTIGMEPFLKDFDKFFAKLYDGCRHDSADPYQWGETLIKHYESLGVDPKTKTAVFSDGLNPDKAMDLAKHFDGKINTSFGIGTNITNDVGAKALSIVIKLVRVNGNPVAKISDEPQKAICEDPEFLSYLKKVYGV